MTIKKTTNYIEFISGLNTSATNAGGKAIARKHESKWFLYDPYSDKPQAVCPITSLRVLIETGKMLEQKHIDYTLSDLLRYGF